MSAYAVPYIVGNTFGRDCINWPTILRSEIEGIFGPLTTDEIDRMWPVDMTAEQVIALAWRVSKWKLSGTSDVTINYVGPGSFPQTIIASGTSEISETDICPLDNGLQAIEKEADLVERVFDPNRRALVNNGVGAIAGAAPVSDWEINGTVSTGGGPPAPFSESGSTPASGFGQLSLNFFGYVLFDPDTGLFAPPIVGLGGLIPPNMVPGGSNSLLLSGDVHRNPQTILSGTGPLLLKAPATLTVISGIAPDFDIPIELAWRLIGEANGSAVSGTGSGDYTLEATEFFPYAGPIYDETDGTRIGNPFA